MNKLLISLLAICFVAPGVAATGPSSMDRKAYPGGRDEDDLKVQVNTRSPVRKINQQTLEAQVRENLFKKKEEEKKKTTSAN